MISFGTVAFALLSLSSSVLAGTKLWDGTFDNYAASTDFDKWSWGNQVGAWQWYIHGSQPTSQYLNVDPSYKNPASSEARGLKLTVDSTSTWNGVFQRTELIPQTNENIGTGHLYYHFSVSHRSTNPPVGGEHQVLFFESHFTEFKYGVGPNQTWLEWHVGGQPYYGVPFTAGTWYNFAYDIDFTAGTVALWASEGSGALKQVYSPVKASTSTNSKDWHLGVLRLNPDSSTEDWYFSGVYVENGPITTSVGSGSAPAPSSSTAGTTPTTVASTTTKPATTVSSSTAAPTSTAVPGTVAQYGQCGGIGYSGATGCVSPYACKKINDYYSQCL